MDAFKPVGVPLALQKEHTCNILYSIYQSQLILLPMIGERTVTPKDVEVIVGRAAESWSAGASSMGTTYVESEEAAAIKAAAATLGCPWAQ
jgi:hypothetical protein